MYIDYINVKNFRNYDSEKIEFIDGLNIIVGNNAQGKTNLIESIYFSCFSKSFRSNKLSELIKMGEELTQCKISIVKRDRKEVIDYRIFKKSREFKVNKANITKLSDLLGTINVIIFTPEDLRIIKDNPNERRKFLNREISQINPKYWRKYVEFNKILYQRNELLKKLMYNPKLKDTIDVWNSQLADAAATIMIMRREYINNLNLFCNEIHKEITEQREELKINYINSYNSCDDIESIKENILKDLEKKLDLDIKRGYTSVGPHRDDIGFKINDIDVKTYGSQGQQRTTALSLKLSEVEIIKNEIGEYPILLLDDVLSELDRNRQEFLLKYTMKLQTIITTASINEVLNKNLDKSKIININDGKINII